MQLDEVLQPHASRERADAPYPVILEGALSEQADGRYLLVDSASLIGPVEGVPTNAVAGDLLVVAISQQGIPYTIYPR